MEKDTKRVWHLPYCFLEPGELERKFARLAAQGWLLEECTYGTYTYRRGEPNEYEYRVQYIYESRDGQRTDYVKTLADMGVEKVGDMGSFLVRMSSEVIQPDIAIICMPTRKSSLSLPVSDAAEAVHVPDYSHVP